MRPIETGEAYIEWLCRRYLEELHGEYVKIAKPLGVPSPLTTYFELAAWAYTHIWEEMRDVSNEGNKATILSTTMRCTCIANCPNVQPGETVIAPLRARVNYYGAIWRIAREVESYLNSWSALGQEVLDQMLCQTDPSIIDVRMGPKGWKTLLELGAIDEIANLGPVFPRSVDDATYEALLQGFMDRAIYYVPPLVAVMKAFSELPNLDNLIELDQVAVSVRDQTRWEVRGYVDAEYVALGLDPPQTPKSE